ncbi:MAG: dTDP-4-dehydrorhamnose reductase [Pyrinomonadaceae bacterium]|nr:dTDP-4-dehydrorhamnose reductase [Pyrinomonadaceae bacterium]
MRILVAGAGGLVGRAVEEHCLAQHDQIFSYTHETLDISDTASVSTTIEQVRPDAVINCAAWTDVDGCEIDSARAHAANANGPENLAKASRQCGAVFVTISTDYVFDGAKEGFYTQRDDPNPISVYGSSKLEGERRAQRALARAIVVRTGFIFGCGGRNFLSTVAERGRRGERLKTISDASGTPTYAPHLAARLRELVELDLPGVFHVVNSGDGASYEQFTRAALEVGGYDQTNLETVTMRSLNRPALRPANSRLKCLLSEAIGLEPLPSWHHALSDFISSEKKTQTVTQG